nr:hypothetical protein [Methylomarinum sp. Ch1-1]MDP4519921.1 hypothetical protein [Methylomarinum sp. Ch1-1]
MIKKPNFATVFSETYYDLLTSNLVKNNAAVIKDPIPSATTISYKINVVTHNKSSSRPDTFLPLSTFVYYVTAEATEVVKAPFYAIKDQLLKNLSSITEVVVTTQAHKDNLVVSSNSNIYYIETKNSMNYLGTSPTTGNSSINFDVVGD